MCQCMQWGWTLAHGYPTSPDDSQCIVKLRTGKQPKAAGQTVIFSNLGHNRIHKGTAPSCPHATCDIKNLHCRRSDGNSSAKQHLCATSATK